MTKFIKNFYRLTKEPFGYLASIIGILLFFPTIISNINLLLSIYNASSFIIKVTIDLGILIIIFSLIYNTKKFSQELIYSSSLGLYENNLAQASKAMPELHISKSLVFLLDNLKLKEGHTINATEVKDFSEEYNKKFPKAKK